MFEVGFSELLLIFALALIVLGPERLPKLAQQVGRWVGRARAMARQFRDQLDEEAHNLETKMNVDPGIDTSMDSKSKEPPHAYTAPATPPVVTEPPVSEPPVSEPEEEFYPPDHHMHSSHREEPLAPVTEATPEQAAAPVEPESGKQQDDTRSAP